MKTLITDSLAEEIQNVSKEEARNVFPDSDCQTLARKAGVDYQSLVSDLDTYFYDIWSPCNGIKKLSQKSGVWLADLKAHLERSFFSIHPEYIPLEALVNQDDTPDLYRRLVVFDNLRKNLALYLSGLLAAQRGHEKNGL